MSEANWSEIPKDMLEEICKHGDDADYILLRSVCSSWRSNLPKRPQVPWIFSHCLDTNVNPGHGLYKFPDAEAYVSPRLKDGVTKFPIGSSRGWIAMIGDTPRISLHNPFTGKMVTLPRLPNFPWIRSSNELDNVYHQRFVNYFRVLFVAYKLVLSSQPNETDCAVMALSNTGLDLIYCQKGRSWLQLQAVGGDWRRYSDLIFYKGKFYTVYMYRVFVCDIGTNDAQDKEISTSDSLFADGMTRSVQPSQTSFLVVSSEELLLVAIKRPRQDSQGLDSACNNNFGKHNFQVFQVDLGAGEDSLRLNKKESLGGRVLFLSTKSVSVSADCSPPCRENCIYYIENSGNRTEDNIIVMNMTDGSISSVTGFSKNRLDAVEFQWLTPKLR